MPRLQCRLAQHWPNGHTTQYHRHYWRNNDVMDLLLMLCRICRHPQGAESPYCGSFGPRIGPKYVKGYFFVYFAKRFHLIHLKVFKAHWSYLWKCVEYRPTPFLVISIWSLTYMFHLETCKNPSRGHQWMAPVIKQNINYETPYCARFVNLVDYVFVYA